MENINEQIRTLTKEIGLPGIRKHFEILLEEFSEKEKDYNQFLYSLLNLEYASRLKSRKASRIRQAHFPYKKYLEDLKLEELPSDAKSKLPKLECLKNNHTRKQISRRIRRKRNAPISKNTRRSPN